MDSIEIGDADCCERCRLGGGGGGGVSAPHGPGALEGLLSARHCVRWAPGTSVPAWWIALLVGRANGRECGDGLRGKPAARGMLCAMIWF